MSRVFSFRDLQRIPELSHLNEIDMLSIANDKLINSYLAVLGFNIDAAILYEPSKHRDLQNKVAVGFRAVGVITQDRAYLNSPLCTPTERMIAASFTDMSLTKELAKLSGTSSHPELTDMRVNNIGDNSSKQEYEYSEPDYEEVTKQIEFFTILRDQIRGNPYNEYGSLKTANEYQQ